MRRRAQSSGGSGDSLSARKEKAWSRLRTARSDAGNVSAKRAARSASSPLGLETGWLCDRVWGLKPRELSLRVQDEKVVVAQYSVPREVVGRLPVRCLLRVGDESRDEWRLAVSVGRVDEPNKLGAVRVGSNWTRHHPRITQKKPDRGRLLNRRVARCHNREHPLLPDWPCSSSFRMRQRSRIALR